MTYVYRHFRDLQPSTQRANQLLELQLYNRFIASGPAIAAARLLPATEQVHEADTERKQEVKNDRGGDEEIDDTDKDQVNLCIALVYVPRGVL